MRQQVPIQVIRRRRLLGLIILAAIIWGIWAGISAVVGLFTGGNHKAPAKIEACAAGVVSVNAYAGDGVKHQDTFDAATRPYIWFSLINNGKVSCTFNAGPAVQFFRIKSGAQIIWSSEQCDRTGLTNQDIVLKPGQPQTSPPSQWFRVYSSNTGCGVGQAPALPGAYSLVAEVNKVQSTNFEQFALK